MRGGDPRPLSSQPLGGSGYWLSPLSIMQTPVQDGVGTVRVLLALVMKMVLHQGI
jgi:hypothetical protein